VALLDTIKANPLPLATLLGIEFVSAQTDEVIARMLVRPDLCTAGKAIHGGAVMALADTVGAMATFVNLPAGARGTTTLESKTNFVGPASVGDTVIAIATPIHRGRRTQVWQTRVEREDGKLVAVVTQTQMAL